MSKIILEEQATPDTPTTDKVAIYPKAGGGVYKKNDAGAEAQLIEAGGDLGTPSAGNLGSCTGLPLATGIVPGAANLKAFVNAAGTAPEWANGIKLGTFSRAIDAADGDVSYTGVGFKPSLVLFFGGTAATIAATFLGGSNGTNHYSLNNYPTAGQVYIASAYCIFLSTPTSSDYEVANLKTLDSDGFTLTWIKGGNPSAITAIMFYVALR